MVNQWFKFYGGEFLSDPKIEQLTAIERSCWVTLLCLASMQDKDGLVEHLKVGTLLLKSGVFPTMDVAGETVTISNDSLFYQENLGVLEHFQHLGMVERVAANSYQITNWTKRQETALTNAERQAKWRERNAKVTEPVTKVTLEEKRVEENRILNAEYRVEVEEKEKKITPEMRQVFSLFEDNAASITWGARVSQRNAAKVLFDKYGMEELSQRYRISQKYRNEDLCPQINTPVDFLDKMPNMERFLKDL